MASAQTAENTGPSPLAVGLGIAGAVLALIALYALALTRRRRRQGKTKGLMPQHGVELSRSSTPAEFTSNLACTGGIQASTRFRVVPSQPSPAAGGGALA